MKCNEKNLFELTKDESKAIQGIALLFMLCLHLFCRKNDLPYHVNFFIKDVPLLYYIGLWGDQCVALFCFCAGYASYLKQENVKPMDYVKNSIKRIVKLMINFWIIIMMFSSISIVLGHGMVMPGSLSRLLGNLFLIGMSYNGAWWFLLTYILLVALSPLLYRVVKKINNVIAFVSVGAVYFVAYLCRFGMISFQEVNSVTGWLIEQGALLGTSILPFIWGMLFYKNKIITRLRNKVYNLSTIKKSCMSVVVFLLCIVSHGIEESLILAPIYAIVTVCLVSLWSGKIIRVLKYIGEHSTNMWLVHMFFYMTIFDNFIFIFKYPILIYTVMFVLCLCSSYIINYILSFVIGRVSVLQ